MGNRFRLVSIWNVFVLFLIVELWYVNVCRADVALALLVLYWMWNLSIFGVAIALFPFDFRLAV